MTKVSTCMILILSKILWNYVPKHLKHVQYIENMANFLVLGWIRQHTQISCIFRILHILYHYISSQCCTSRLLFFAWILCTLFLLLQQCGRFNSPAPGFFLQSGNLTVIWLSKHAPSDPWCLRLLWMSCRMWQSLASFLDCLRPIRLAGMSSFAWQIPLG